jgi:CheY-like chemotaxis protein
MAAKNKPVSARRILVVDDNKEAADATVKLLRSIGHTVKQAYDGSSAMSLAMDFEPEFVFLDLVMPGMDGLELATELRTMFPIRPPKIIALTAFPQPAFRDAAKWAGFDEYLKKPASLETLSKVLKS